MVATDPSPLPLAISQQRLRAPASAIIIHFEGVTASPFQRSNNRTHIPAPCVHTSQPDSPATIRGLVDWCTCGFSDSIGTIFGKGASIMTITAATS